MPMSNQNPIPDLSSICIPKGEAAICWLGQAGFWVKDADGTTFVIDPYLSDCGMRIRGFRRLSAQFFTLDMLKPDYYCITHTHFDHFDYDTVPLALSQTQCRFAGPTSCQQELEKLGVPAARRTLLNVGDCDDFRGLHLEAVRADHGTMAPDAIGVLLRVGRHTLYFSGDTAYHPEWNAQIRTKKPNIGFLSMNGAFGNMDAHQAANTAAELGLSIAIPCHFWTFAEHGGDPFAFVSELRNRFPACTPRPMRQGEVWITEGGHTL